jgi:hypothetical protein
LDLRRKVLAAFFMPEYAKFSRKSSLSGILSGPDVTNFGILHGVIVYWESRMGSG